jgi:hypothetical protein
MGHADAPLLAFLKNGHTGVRVLPEPLPLGRRRHFEIHDAFWLSVSALCSGSLFPAGLANSAGLSLPSAAAFAGSFSAGGASDGIPAVASAFTLALAGSGALAPRSCSISSRHNDHLLFRQVVGASSLRPFISTAADIAAVSIHKSFFLNAHAPFRGTTMNENDAPQPG